MTSSQNLVPKVTIIIVPRESFGYSRRSLESLYTETKHPFDLIYVDAGSPPSVRRYLSAQAAVKGFRLMRTEHYLSPNRARNLGLREAHTEYVVFADNDILFHPGWLDGLVRCAEETGSAIVGPLTYVNEPPHETVHNAGGEIWIEERNGLRHIAQKTCLLGQRASGSLDGLRFPCGYVEFHTLLVRTNLFKKIGPLDEGLLSTREHIDLCLSAREAGESVYCERSSIVTYLSGVTATYYDVAYYMLRWSDAWDLASLAHFRAKWSLADDTYFENRYRKVGARRYLSLMEPLVRLMPLGDSLKNFMKKIERPLNALISDRYAKRHDYARGSYGLRRQRMK